MTQVLLYFTVANGITYRPFTCKLFVFHLQMCIYKCVYTSVYILVCIYQCVYTSVYIRITNYCILYSQLVVATMSCDAAKLCDFYLNNSHNYVIKLNLYSHSVYQALPGILHVQNFCLMQLHVYRTLRKSSCGADSQQIHEPMAIYLPLKDAHAHFPKRVSTPACYGHVHTV